MVTLAPELHVKGEATVAILERLGHAVEVPAGQTCCGQLHFNTGYRDEAVPLVARFAAVFAGYDAIVTPSPSCAAMVRQHHGTVAAHAVARGADPGLPAAVAAVAPRLLDLSELLVDELGVLDLGARFAQLLQHAIEQIGGERVAHHFFESGHRHGMPHYRHRNKCQYVY